MVSTTSIQTAHDRDMPWDVMGAPLQPKATMNVAAAMKEAGLDYTVSVKPAAAEDGGGLLQAPGFQAVTRPINGVETVMAFTRKRYTPIQNVDAFSVGDTLVREHGAKIIGAADFKGGDRSLLALDLLGPVELETPDGGVDRVDLDLLIVNDHAGNAALNLALTPIRLACTNVLPAAIRGAERVWKISHTPNAMKRYELAAEAIVKAAAYRDAFQLQAQAMMEQEMVDAEFQKMVAKLYPVRKDQEGVQAERRRDIQATLLSMWQNAETIKSIQGTRWAGYNVVTEYLDHFRPVRGEEGVARAEGALDGPYVRQKANLWNMFAAA